MSREVSDAVWQRIQERTGPKLTAPAIVVLLALADYQNKDSGQLNPSVKTLGRRTSLLTSTVSRVLNELVESGDLIIDGGRRGGRRPNSYRLTVHTPLPLQGAEVSASAETRPPSWQRSGLRNDPRKSPSTQRRTLEPVNEPSRATPNRCIDCNELLDEERRTKTRCAPCQRDSDILYGRARAETA